MAPGPGQTSPGWGAFPQDRSAHHPAASAQAGSGIVIWDRGNTIDPRMLKLEVLNTAFKGKQFRFKEGLVVGSAEGCAIRAQHTGMQPEHARFYTDNNHSMVEIACKEAHLYINGRDVVRSELRHQDEITIGPLRLRVVDDSRVSSGAMQLDQLLTEMEGQEASETLYDFAREDLFYLSTKDPALRTRINFVIPSKDKFIDQAQVFLARLVKGGTMDEQQVDSFMTCAKELILNAHRHGHTYDESKRITLRFRDAGDRISLTIIDEGKGFDHRGLLAKVNEKDAAQAARERYQAGGFGGLGFKLITKLAKDLTYNESGNQVTFTVMKQPTA
jgi:anti-sigma regulatory factor (Ser/Thr protein kinase)